MTNNTEQQAVPVAQIDWRLIAKAAGEHGVRYRTNTALLAFLDAIEPARKADRFDPALPCKSGEGAGGWIWTPVDLTVLTANGLRGRYAPESNGAFVHPDDAAKASALTPDATQTREAELVAENKRLRELLGDYGDKRAPVQGLQGGIPWDMHLRAYDAYSRQYSSQKSLIEGGCRGGFGIRELDMFIPGWREELEGRANAARSVPRAALNARGGA